MFWGASGWLGPGSPPCLLYVLGGRAIAPHTHYYTFTWRPYEHKHRFAHRCKYRCSQRCLDRYYQTHSSLVGCCQCSSAVVITFLDTFSSYQSSPHVCLLSLFPVSLFSGHPVCSVKLIGLSPGLSVRYFLCSF